MPREFILGASLRFLALVLATTFGSSLPPPPTRDPKTQHRILAPQADSCSASHASVPTKWICVQQKTSLTEQKPYCRGCFVHPDYHTD